MIDVVFEKFDKFLISSTATRWDVQAIYKFKNKYRVCVARKPFYDVSPSKMGLWRVELLGHSDTVKPNKPKNNDENAWLRKFFSIETEENSDSYVWYLNENDVETILGEVKSIKEPLKIKLKRLFKF